MTCMCGPYVHKATALSETGLLTVTNASNVSNLDPFVLILCVNPNNIITGTPLNLTMTLNGGTVNVLNRYGLPVTTDRLMPRRRYLGRYIVPTIGTPYVILLDTPLNIAYALSAPATAATTTTDDDGE